MNKDVAALLVVLSLTILLVLYFGLESRITSYVIFVALVLAGCVIFASASLRELAAGLGGKRPGLSNLSQKEKETVILSLLDALDSKKAVSVEALSSELGVEVEDLSSILESLGKRNVVRFIYPPMEKKPLVLKGDELKARELCEQLKISLERSQRKG